MKANRRASTGNCKCASEGRGEWEGQEGREQERSGQEQASPDEE